MSARRSLAAAGGNMAPPFRDHVYESGSPFDFNSDLRHQDTQMASFGSMGPNAMDFDMVDDMYDEDMGQELFGGPDGHFRMDSSVYNQHYGNSNPSGQMGQQRLAQSNQSEIVNSRRDNVKEQFGQITPPDMAKELSNDPSSLELSESQQSKEDIAKLNRTQRARNAANKRHSKSKTLRAENNLENGSEVGDGDGEDGKSTSLQREKNRVAAAKCRAKKKANSEEMQEYHREGARQNSYLQREVRELRDQKAFLRNTLLQHDPGVCQCHAIHRFNMAQAHQLAFGVHAMAARPTSPSQESGGSGQTPASDTSAGRTYAASESGGAPRRMSIASKPHPNLRPSNYTFGQITSPDPTISATSSVANIQQMPQHFTEFLHSSPQGRAGFS